MYSTHLLERIVQLLLEWNDNPCQCYHVLSMVSLMTCCCFWKGKALNSLQCLLQVHNDLTRIETEPSIQESNPLLSLCHATTLPQKWKYSTVGTKVERSLWTVLNIPLFHCKWTLFFLKLGDFCLLIYAMHNVKKNNLHFTHGNNNNT